MLPFRHHHELSDPRQRAMRFVLHILIGIAIACVLVFLFGSAVMYLWNTVMPPLFSVGQLTFWRAIGLLLLARILVGSFRGHGGPRHRFGGRSWGRCDSPRQYEDWWREVGEQSFRDYAAQHGGDERR
jgi:hypothetical protein